MLESAYPHLIVIGGGFAGLTAIRNLASHPVRITLVDQHNHHLFQPLLYQVATAGLSAPDIAAPLRHILRHQRNVDVRLATVTGIDTEGRQVHLADGTRLDFDLLLVASGATHAYFGNDHWATAAPGLKTLNDALSLRRRLLLAFEHAEAEDDPMKQAAWLSFVVVGAGPTGVELAGTMAEIARHTLKNQFKRIDPAAARVRLVEAGPRVLASFPDTLSEKAREQLESLGVDVCTGTPVTGIDADGVTLGTRQIPARTVVWAAGVAASPLGRLLGVPVDRAGRVVVESDLTLPGNPSIFVAGDLATVPGADARPVPGVAPAAKQMGRHVARVIAARLANNPPPPPFAYNDQGNMATIGRMAAIVHVGRWQFSGVTAWWFWLLVHVLFLIGFRNRVVVLLNWAVAYWSYQRSARIILGPPSGENRENTSIPENGSTVADGTTTKPASGDV